MAVKNLQITIQDDDGVAHYYEFTPHPAGLSIGLVNDLQTILLSPLTTLVAGTRQTKQGGGLLDREISPEAGQAAAMALAKAIAAAGKDQYVKQLLSYAHTRRNGDAKLMKVSEHFDYLYTQNLGEMALAIYHAVETSWGKSVRRFLKGQPLFRELLSSVQALGGSSPQTSEPPSSDSPT